MTYITKMEDLREAWKTNILELRGQLDLMEKIYELMPDIPRPHEFGQLQTFPVPEMCNFMISLNVNSRAEAAELVSYFTPQLLCFSERVSPRFRMARRVNPFDFQTLDFKHVFPVIFTSVLDRNIHAGQSEFASQLIWYWQPMPIVPEIVVMMSVNILEDKARVYENGTENLPEGFTFEEPQVEEGLRCVTVYWQDFAELSLGEWYERFITEPQTDENDFWASEIYETEN